MDVNFKICASTRLEIKNRCFMVAMCLKNQPRWRRLQTINSLVGLVYKLEAHQPRSLPSAKRRAKVRVRVTNRALANSKEEAPKKVVRLGTTSSSLISKLSWITMILDCFDWLAELFCSSRNFRVVISSFCGFDNFCRNFSRTNVFRSKY